MSSGGRTIDNRIVGLDFNNEGFESGVKTSLSTLSTLNKTLNNFDGSRVTIGDDLSDSLEGATKKASIFDSALQQIAVGALREIGARIEHIGEKIVGLVNPLNVLDYYLGNVSAGWQKYANKTDAVQTIMSATRSQFEDEEKQFATVNEQLDKLNWFTDETSYSYMDMVSNIGKFTSNGVKLEEAATAMQGISTWAALSGANVNEAGRAMYNLSQAMGVGAVTLMDWKSIENANMATVEFKETALATAAVMGMLKQEADGTYKTLNGNVVTVESFRESLKDKWFTGDVLTTTLGIYGEFADKLYEVQTALNYDSATPLLSALDEFMEKREDFDFKSLADSLGLGDEDIEDLKKKFNELGADEYELGRRAFAAAQEARTFGQVMDSLKDALSTSFMGIFESIFGNLYEAKDLFSWLVEELYDLIVAPVKGLQELMAEWHDAGGRLILIEAVTNLWEAFRDILGAVGKAFSDIFPAMDKDKLMDLTERFKIFTEQLKPSEGFLTAVTNAFKTFIYYVGGVGIKMIGGFLLKFISLKTIAFAFISYLFTLEPIAKFVEALFNGFSRLVSLGPTLVSKFKEFSEIFSNTAFGQRMSGWIDKAKEGFTWIGGWIDWLTGWLNYFFSLDIGQLDLKKIAKGLSDSLEAAWAWVSKIFDSVKKFFSAPLFKNAFKSIKSLPNDFKVLKSALTETEEYQKFIDIINKIKNALQNGLGKAITFVKEKIDEFNKSHQFRSAGFNPLEIIIPIIGALTIVGEKLIAVVKNVKEFFSSIGAGEALLRIGDSIKNLFTEGFSIDSIKEAASNIGSAFVDVFKNIRDRLKNGDFKAAILAEDWIKGFADGIKSKSTYAFDIIKEFFSGMFGKIASWVGSIKNFFPNIFSSLTNLKVSLPELNIFSGLSNSFNKLFGSFSGITKKFNSFLDPIKKILNGEWLKDFKASDTYKQLSPYLENFRKVFDAINTFLGTDVAKVGGPLLIGFAILKNIKKFFKLLLEVIKSPFDLLKDILDGSKGLFGIPKTINKFIEGLGKAVDSWVEAQNKLTRAKARKETALALLAFAGAVAIFAGTIWFLANVPMDDFEGAVLMIGAITVGVAALAYALSKFEASRADKKVGEGLKKVGDGMKQIGDGLKRIGTGIVLFGFVAAIATLVGAFLILKNAFSGGNEVAIVNASLALGLMVTAVVLAMKQLNGVKVPISTAMSLVGFGAALALMTIPMKALAGMDWSQVAKAVTGIGALVVIITYATNNVKPLGVIGLALALVAFAGALVLIVPQLMALSIVPWTGLLSAAAVVAALVAAAVVLGKVKGSIKGLALLAVGLLALGVAFRLLAPVLSVIGKDLDALKAFGIILGGLVAAGLIAGLPLVSNGLMAISLSLLAIAAAAMLFALAFDIILNALNSLPAAVETSSKGVAKNGDNLTSGLTTLINSVLTAIDSNIPTMIATFGRLLEEVVLGGLETIGGMLDKIVNTLTKFIGQIAEQLAKKGGAIWDAIDYLLLSVLDFLAEGIGRLLITIGEKIGGSFGEKLKDAGETLKTALDDDLKEAEQHFKESQTALAVGDAITARIKEGFKGNEITVADLASVEELDWATVLSPNDEDKNEVQTAISNLLKTKLSTDQLNGLQSFYNDNIGPDILERLGLSLETLSKNADKIQVITDGYGNITVSGLEGLKDELTPGSPIASACDESGKATVNLMAEGIGNADDAEIVAKGIEALTALKDIDINDEGFAPVIVALKNVGVDLTGYLSQGAKDNAEQLEKDFAEALTDPLESGAADAADAAGQTLIDKIGDWLEVAAGLFHEDWMDDVSNEGYAPDALSIMNEAEVGGGGGGMSKMVLPLSVDKEKMKGYIESQVKEAVGEVSLDENSGENVGQSIIDGVVQPFSDTSKITTPITTFANAGTNAAKETWGIQSPSTVFHEIGSNLILGTTEGIDEQTQPFIDNLVQKFNDATDEVKGFLEMSGKVGKSQLYMTIGEAIMMGLMEGLENKRSPLMDTMNSIMGQLYETGQSWMESFHVLGYNIGSAIAEGASWAEGLVYSAGARIFAAFYAGAAEAAQVASPSKVMMRFGNYLGMGMAMGVEDTSGMVEQAAENMIDETMAGISNAILNINDAIYEGIDTTPVIRPVVDLTDVQNGLATANTAFDSVSLQAKATSYTPVVVPQTKSLLGALDTLSRKSDRDKEPTIGVINVNVNGEGKDVREIADEVREVVVMELQRGRMVWA